jgi:transcriptional regulator with XRE-family HTH domain
MDKFPEAREILTGWGLRLREARLARNDSMEVFAHRIGVSVATIRDMERGVPTVQVGTWLNALAILERLDEVEGLLRPKASLIEQARLERLRRPRIRASRRKGAS